MSNSVWQIAIDTGGTFTDVVARAPDGARRRVKLLSSSALRGRLAADTGRRAPTVDAPWGRSPALVGCRLRRLDDPSAGSTVVDISPDGRLQLDLPADDRGSLTAGTAVELVSDEPAPLLAIRLLTATRRDEALPPMDVRLATTLGTNTLLERSGRPPALFITAGLGDLLHIGDQRRPDLFALHVILPSPLFGEVVEVPERLAADGSVVQALDVAAVERAGRALRQRGVQSAAVCLLHADRHPAHENEIVETLKTLGFRHVVAGSQLVRRIRIVPRATTAVVDAYLSPVLEDYLSRIVDAIGGDALRVMTSAGGLAPAARFRAKDGLLSGPAGGVVGAAGAGRAVGRDRVISFDMGGTSTDVARHDGAFDYAHETRVGDAELMTPALAIHTVAAGGGSICRVDGRRLTVGPESAGADPGPACYGRGGPLTVTDVNLLLGRLDASRFEIPIDEDAARRKLGELEADLHTAGETDPDAILEGLLDIADEKMADAIRSVSLRRGYDPSEFALVAFGGAGGQHACAIAERLDMHEVLFPPGAAVLSAHGLEQAALERFAEVQLLAPLDAAAAGLAERFGALDHDARAALIGDGAEAGHAAVRERTIRLRFVGQDQTVEIPWQDGTDLAGAFRDRYRRLFGHIPGERAIEIDTLRVRADDRREESPVAPDAGGTRPATPEGRHRVRLAGVWRDVDGYAFEALSAGDVVAGPALVFERHSAFVVPAGWRAVAVSTGGLRCLRNRAVAGAATARPEAVQLELFTQRCRSIVREMGDRLERTAISTNVKERLDFSCALLDADGRLVANAPHVPVHLGALGLCVRSIRDTLPLGPGDVVVTNHPGHGGSHLPDVTVVTPVFAGDDPGRPLGFVASRAHHAEIGGCRPGSMPPDARRLVDEGVVLSPFHLIEGGTPRWERLEQRLLAPPWPTRRLDDNLADVRAAVAANQAGRRGLQALATARGAGDVRESMAALFAEAANRVGEALERLDDGEREAEEALDDGTRIHVRVAVAGRRATIDLAGTSPRHPGNLNATPAIVSSAVLYVLRLLIEKPLPLNEGLLEPVELRLPTCFLSPGFDGPADALPAVVGGNVETSQRLVDTLIRAFALAACGQGTMNNVIFGTDRVSYYETIGGGGGAGPGYAGASGRHVHMTNTRITDPEILESRYPVRLDTFGLRPGSGGAGRWRGGDGVVRALTFLEPVTLSVLTQHRKVAPYGLAGGDPGRPGRQWIERAGGGRETLGAIDGAELNAGDRLVIETPGGGGWGAAE